VRNFANPRFPLDAGESNYLVCTFAEKLNGSRVRGGPWNVSAPNTEDPVVPA